MRKHHCFVIALLIYMIIGISGCSHAFIENKMDYEGATETRNTVTKGSRRVVLRIERRNGKVTRTLREVDDE